ncbi:indolepyruvate ferredoxin oxidoreductase family protein [Phenylobacterium sp.]|uniref:indolepyruvate ferredoxin oxidoreductase family protein n=1 Tax=Phenylobacterium sp. TaxID=1871053 RepID=UPI002E3254BB|nr:indolepyruvate ferredoxin oxidoreductase family protein [Phenylobacterium sp.]HEX3364639.1 indolepyruvate ferredoxin oxidoreductase family protein [Phenylobacterium sp.]
MPLPLTDVSLADKYTRTQGRIFLSGIQALVRLPLLQVQGDAASGLRTAAFISGYRGSPIGGFDSELWRERERLAQHNIYFEPGLNEDLALTSVWGSQQVNLFPGATMDGVCGLWYGKSPGVDRSIDALKHANAAGTSARGGVLAIAGDDHDCQSSTLPNQSEQVFEAAMVPVLNPSGLEDYLEFGLRGFELSRYSGCWVGFTAVGETLESSANLELRPAPTIVAPAFEMPPGGLNIRLVDTPLESERRLHGPRMAAVAAFAHANPFDRVVMDSPQARLGIATTGKAYLDVRQALADLGITDARARELGLRVYKIGLTWPLQADLLRRFADGLQDILVVEEKRAFIETQITRILYNTDAASRPAVVGKRDETGAPLLPSEGALNPVLVAAALLRRLERLGHRDPELQAQFERIESFRNVGNRSAVTVSRTPFFCSGCPHNRSTEIPDGSRGLGGIGCHALVLRMPARRTPIATHMGAEGANWIGQAPFTTEGHVFQNLGDGTYSHSGLLAIRAAAAAGVSITYKILFNDAVAMTGGQPVEGGLTVPQMAGQVAAEGARCIVIVTDEPGKYATAAGLPPAASVRHRDDLDAVQRELREVKGLTVLIYDQTCAAEKRRRRKRGLMIDPPKRAFINTEVCEGCGDCSAASNCISVSPIETDLGRKRAIDQSNCNKDFSCVDGFCPSFVTVRGGALRKVAPAAQAPGAAFASLPRPTFRGSSRKPYSVLVTGVGGTGVLTLSALLGMASHLEGHWCSVLDNTGAAQKNGSVTSHVRIAPRREDLSAVRISAGGADLVLACDMMVANEPTSLATIDRDITRAVVNACVQPTGSFVLNTDLDLEAPAMRRSLEEHCRADAVDFVDATAIASSLLGDSMASNVFMLGIAYQKGLIPFSLAALERAIELNGVAIEANKRALAWGRLAAHDLPKVLQAAFPYQNIGAPAQRGPADVIADRTRRLQNYQGPAYARRYLASLDAVRAADERVGPGTQELTVAVARNLYKLMAYKDEYEVARLYSSPAFAEQMRETFDGPFKLAFHLAPPFLPARKTRDGRRGRMTFGPWMAAIFPVLASLRGLRGTPFDLFGYSAERRAERQYVQDYEALVRSIIEKLDRRTYATAVALASAPDGLRGYGHIKAASAERWKAREAELIAELDGGQAARMTELV